MTRTRRTYTDTVKAEAVRLVVEAGYRVSAAARNPGLNANMLSRWKHELGPPSAARYKAADE